jgi:hypothetical protein
VSSNGKSNLIMLSIFNQGVTLILNGLGRWERNLTIRRYILFRMKHNKLKLICQSYRDFRYFRRYGYFFDRLFWVPGSGGSKRKTGSGDSLLMVSRDDKIAFHTRDLEVLSGKSVPITIVGLNKPHLALTEMSSIELKNYVPQKEIFLGHRAFLQLDGYGEGVPHSLCDAIVSDMDLVINKRCWIRFGFYRFFVGVKSLKFDSYFHIRNEGKNQQSLKARLNIDHVNKLYLKIINS